MKFFVNCLVSIFILYLLHEKSSATVLSARCRSRCFAKEVETHRNITLISECVTEDCSACMKPCEKTKKEKLSCPFICGSSVIPVKSRNACMESCKFFKRLHIEGGNLSCVTGLVQRQCNSTLMQPEDVEVSLSSNDESLNFSINWNGSWPSATVFVVLTRQQAKRVPADEDTSQGWMELIQTTHTSIKVEAMPLLWHQYKVAAVTQYGSSAFSIPSRLVFVNPRRPRPPRDFHVVSMQTVKGHIQVDLSWRKPDNTIALPIHRYRLQWSMRPDVHLDEFISLKVTDKRISGKIHRHTIDNLQPNRTYLLEIQAISRWKRRRLRSHQVTLRIQTPALAEDVMGKKSNPNKKTEIKKNKITNSKKITTNGGALLGRPTVVTVMHGTSSPKISSVHLSQAPIPVNNETSNLQAQRNAASAGVTSISLLLIMTAFTVIIWW